MSTRPFQIIAADHTGFTVSNIERSLVFWHDVLGFTLSHRAPFPTFPLSCFPAFLLSCFPDSITHRRNPNLLRWLSQKRLRKYYTFPGKIYMNSSKPPIKLEELGQCLRQS